MKTRKSIYRSLVLIVSIVFALAACDPASFNPNNPDANAKSMAIDENTISDIDTEIMNDVDQILTQAKSKSKSKYFPCNTVIDSVTTIGDTAIFHITFMGNNCPVTYSRYGKLRIRIEAQTNWLSQGATVKVFYDDILVTRISDGAWLKLNGTRSLTNVSGGAIADLGTSATTISHEAEGDVFVDFSDSTTFDWNLARRTTFTSSANNVTLSVDGFGSAAGYNDLVWWGVNRQNVAFYTEIQQTVVHEESCGWDAVAGIKKLYIPANNQHLTLTFGYDANNQPITPGNCPDKFKLEWFNNGNYHLIYQFL